MTEVKRAKQIVDVFKFLKLCKLNQKHKEVVTSMEKYFEKYGDLSESQTKYLFDIYERVA